MGNLELIKETMSSLQIAEITGKEHSNVMRDIRVITEQLGDLGGFKFELSCYKSQQNKELPMYILTKKECLLLSSGYDALLRAKIINRWEELETEKKSNLIVMPDFTNPADAAIATDCEIWKCIDGFSHHQISNEGRVRSLDMDVWNGRILYRKKGRIIKPFLDKDGYKCTNLSSNSIRKNFKVHRLVAEQFILNPHCYTQVNHRDENKTNNNINNLEWCTVKYNNNYGTARSRGAKKMSKRVIQYTTNMIKVKEYNSASDAARENGIDQWNVSGCCNGRCKSYNGFIWRYII